MRRKPFSLLPPKTNRRRWWTVLIRPPGERRKQFSAGTPHRAAAAEFAILKIRQDFPVVCRLLDLKPLKLPRLDGAAAPPKKRLRGLKPPLSTPPR